MNRREKEPIDFVITWVDGNDPKWQEAKEKTLIAQGLGGHIDGRKERYRDWDNLQYWFRGVEKYAPWVRKIHFVTWGHVPEWLNVDHPKLHIVKHEDFIPKEFLRRLIRIRSSGIFTGSRDCRSIFCILMMMYFC